MSKPRAFLFVIAAAVVLIAAVGGYAVFLADKPRELHSAAAVWTEVSWPFPLDQWGRGRAFQCKAADCGSELNLFLRAKIGFCNCAIGWPTTTISIGSVTSDSSTARARHSAPADLLVSTG